MKVIDQSKRVWLLATLTAVMLQGCGGSSGADTTLEGVAAVGAPLAGAQVEFICVTGNPGTVTTASDGSWTSSARDIVLPCAIEVTGGTLGAGGPANTAVVHSLVLTTGVANATTLSSLQLAALTELAPGSWFSGLRANASSLQGITEAQRAAALVRVRVLLAALPTPVTLADGFDPMTTRFVANKNDDADQLLERLAKALSDGNITLSDALTKVASRATPVGATPVSLSLAPLSSFGSGVLGGSEITAYDANSKRLFVVNGSGIGSIEVWNIATPVTPVAVTTINQTVYGSNFGGFNSVAVHDGVVALALQANPKTSNGTVIFLRASDLVELSRVTVGALPDMVTFTPDGRYLLVANEGEPDSYNNPTPGVTSIDPEGSVSIIDVRDIAHPVERKATFVSFNSQIDSLRASGVRIYGPNATVAQDLEPEYITVSSDSKTAWVTLQENNAVAVVDIASATVTSIKPLGFKDHSIAGFGMDVSNEDGGTNTNSGTPLVKIRTVPVKGMYLPDGIASYTVGATTYYVTANEGDARADWPGFTEETRVREYCAAGGMDPAVFGANAAELLFDSNLGRLRITNTPNGGQTGKNGSGQCNELYAYGGRSFSIWNAATGQRVYDSGDSIETIIASLAGTSGNDFLFNSGHDENVFDGRSPNKGPEPEGVVLQRFGTKVFAFIGLERVGGVMVYDVTNPAVPVHVTYINTRTGATGPRGPEGLLIIPAAKSPSGVPLLVVGNEISGTTSIFEIRLNY